MQTLITLLAFFSVTKLVIALGLLATGFYVWYEYDLKHGKAGGRVVKETTYTVNCDDVARRVENNEAFYERPAYQRKMRYAR